MGSRRDLRRKERCPCNRQRSTAEQQRLQHKDRCRLCTYKQNTSEGVTSVINVQVSVECRGVVKYALAMDSADATSAEHMITLPFPLRVLCAIAFASRSIWNRRPLNFSTDQRPLESMSRSNTPAVAVFAAAPCSATL